MTRDEMFKLHEFLHDEDFIRMLKKFMKECIRLEVHSWDENNVNVQLYFEQTLITEDSIDIRGIE